MNPYLIGFLVMFAVSALAVGGMLVVRRLVGVETHLRSVSHVTELLAPWQVTEDRAVEDYLNMTGTVGGNHMIQSRRFWALMAKR